jgi:hypothetical protein
MRGFRGVSKSRRGHYDVRLRVRGKRIFVGRYWSLEAACDAYDQAAIQHYGDKAITNRQRT